MHVAWRAISRKRTDGSPSSWRGVAWRGVGLSPVLTWVLMMCRFREAAERGNPTGQSACADMLIKGEGVEQNATEAVAWYQKAAAQNNIRALNGLGYCYYNGQGVDLVRFF